MKCISTCLMYLKTDNGYKTQTFSQSQNEGKVTLFFTQHKLTLEKTMTLWTFFKKFSFFSNLGRVQFFSFPYKVRPPLPSLQNFELEK